MKLLDILKEIKINQPKKLKFVSKIDEWEGTIAYHIESQKGDEVGTGFYNTEDDTLNFSFLTRDVDDEYNEIQAEYRDEIKKILNQLKIPFEEERDMYNDYIYVDIDYVDTRPPK